MKKLLIIATIFILNLKTGYAQPCAEVYLENDPAKFQKNLVLFRRCLEGQRPLPTEGLSVKVRQLAFNKTSSLGGSFGGPAGARLDREGEEPNRNTPSYLGKKWKNAIGLFNEMGDDILDVAFVTVPLGMSIGAVVGGLIDPTTRAGGAAAGAVVGAGVGAIIAVFFWWDQWNHGLHYSES
ncbi:MAG: hypothetical protein HY401_03575 [Elusimicrobia bacterium]|nr:hypothetical protein [Elusimicrobiota bacterium]